MEKRLLKYFLMLLFCMFWLMPVQAQETEPVWIFVKEEKGIKVHYQLNECERNLFVILKVENTTSSSVSFSWSASVGNEQFQVSSGEKLFTVNSSETLIGECLDSRLSSLTFAYNTPFESPVVNMSVNF